MSIFYHINYKVYFLKHHDLNLVDGEFEIRAFLLNINQLHQIVLNENIFI